MGGDQQAANEYLEVEVKFLVSDLTAFRSRLLRAGGRPVKPRQYERNVRFDTPDGALLQQQQLLRLRQDAAVRLTFKGPHAADAASEAKVREEIEVTVDDFERMAAIFQRLGLLPVQVYEKYRETFRLGDVEVVLDETPFGDFVELEAPEAAIRAAVGALDLDWDRRVLHNYLYLLELARREFDLPFSDLTFANFEPLAVDMSELLPLTNTSQ